MDTTRRYRGRHERLGAMLALVLLAGCGKDEAKGGGTDGATETDSAGTTDATTSATTSGGTSAGTTGPGCPPGTETCPCDAGSCSGELVCLSDLCVDPACPPGQAYCACASGNACVADLYCDGTLCLPNSCMFQNDGLCDEPGKGSGLCPPESDAADCCATLQDGQCEEEDMGGSCAAGSDFFDCGYCKPGWVGDMICDEPVKGNGLCPVGSDPSDCCSTPNDGTCEEEGMGGACPAGTDWFDCGYCNPLWVGDGFCDEAGKGGGLCPAGSDSLDCCASKKNKICEETGMGGSCPVGSDSYDCGACSQALEDNLVCDDPFGTNQCPAGTDLEDCCANPLDGTCDEMDQGGSCKNGTDWKDCGGCYPPWLADGLCDEPEGTNLCPEGSDPDDCP